MTGRILMFVPVLLLGAASPAQKPLVWEESYEAAVAKSEATAKPILIYFTTDWCGWCKVMERTTFHDPAVSDQAKGYVPLKLDAEKEGKTLAAAHKVAAYPTFVLVDSKGKKLGRIDGYLEAPAFLSRMKSLLAGESEALALEERVKRNPLDGEALARLATLALAGGDVEAAESRLAEAEKSGWKGSELALAYSQLGSHYGVRNPAKAEAAYRKSIALKDRQTMSMTFDRVILLGALTQNSDLIKEMAAAAYAQPDISPELRVKVERVVKGPLQSPKLQTPEGLADELLVQLTGAKAEERDIFFFKNLMLEDAFLGLVWRVGGRISKTVVDQGTFLRVLGVDTQKAAWKRGETVVRQKHDLAVLDMEVTSEWEDKDGKKIQKKAQIQMSLVNMGSRWYIGGLTLQMEPSESRTSP